MNHDFPPFNHRPNTFMLGAIFVDYRYLVLEKLAEHIFLLE